MRDIKWTICIALAVMVYSCTRGDDNLYNQETNKIDSIIVRSHPIVTMIGGDTVRISVEVYPKTASLNDDMILSHQIFLKRVPDCLMSGGGNNEPTEYIITGIQKDEDQALSTNRYNLLIADTDPGHGYRDTVAVCIKHGDVASLLSSNSFVLNNTGTTLSSFSLSDGISTWEYFNVKNDTIQIQVPRTFNLSRATAIFKHNGKYVFMNGENQQSGKTVHDFSDFCYPNEYFVQGFDGDEKKYVIEIFNLPIVYVNTPNSVDITSRYEWLENCSFTIRDTNGTIDDYGVANVKGRGNWSWRVGMKNGKKPLAIKLANKPKEKSVLGMPGHKRWVLLANPLDYLPNPVGFEINRRAEFCKWAPRSRYVELMLNGTHKGLYLLCEQIRVDKNRVDIEELKKSDLEGDAITGGYLISYDDAEEDQDPKFYSQHYNMPVMIKNPDADDIQPAQLEYIKNYINQAELSLYDDEQFKSESFYHYFDIDSWIDYYFVAELWGAYELKRPRSVWLFKNRGGKLTAGPAWDLEENYFNEKKLYCNNALYYARFFQSKSVLERLKNKWVGFRSNLVGNERYGSVLQFVDSLYNECKYSADRDRKMTPSEYNYYLPNPESTIHLEYQVIRNNILTKIEWMNEQIMSW